MSASRWEETLGLQIAVPEIGEGMVREHRFAPPRRWRFDFAWPKRLVAAEVEGGQWIRGRHTGGDGFARDAEKYNFAALNGWLVLRFVPSEIRSGDAVPLIERALATRRVA